MKDIVTADFSNFGYREIDLAQRLLYAYAHRRMTDRAVDWFGDGVQIMFNTHSGFVFLSDEDYNTLMFNNGLLDLFLYCPNCGNEGFAEEIYENPQCDECKDFAKNYMAD